MKSTGGLETTGKTIFIMFYIEVAASPVHASTNLGLLSCAGHKLPCSWSCEMNHTCMMISTNYCSGMRRSCILRQRVHSIIDKPLSLSRSQSTNSFLPHFRPRLTFPRIFFMVDVRNSLDTSSLSLFLSNRLNFQIKTWLSVRKVPKSWRFPDLALLRWFLIDSTVQKQERSTQLLDITQTQLVGSKHFQRSKKNCKIQWSGTYFGISYGRLRHKRTFFDPHDKTSCIQFYNCAKNYSVSPC